MTLCNKQNTHTHTHRVSLCVSCSFHPQFLSYFKIQNDSIINKFQRTQAKYIERLAKLNKYCEGSWENNYNPLRNHRTIMAQSNF